MSKLSLNTAMIVGEKRTVSVQFDETLTVCPEQLSFKILNGTVRELF